jgi:hypothetical protein
MRPGIRDDLKDLMIGKLLNIDIRAIVANQIQANGNYIEDLNRDQLEHGQLSDGSDIKPFYKKGTVVARKKKGLQTAVVDLKDEEKFYKGIRTKPVANGDTELDSADPKTPYLVKRYSDRIFGLTVPSTEQLQDRLKPFIQDDFKQALQR